MNHSKATHAFTTRQTPNPVHAGGAVAATHDDIAKRAYEIYVRTGRRQGQCKQNWLQAEQDLRDEGQAACRSAQCTTEPHDGHRRSQDRR